IMQLDDLTDQQLLKMRLCDLPVRIEGSLLESRIKRLFEELRSRSIRFRPYYWLSEEWFTPDNLPGFAIPFYLAHPRLIRLDRSQMKQAEGSTEAECMRILRHETGHALGNAFHVHTRKAWKDAFGSFQTPYPDWYQPQPGSRDYVLNLDAWYAQAHPAEDFAETFAVWLKQGTYWQSRYEGWGAQRKLTYLDELMAELAEKQTKRLSHREVESLPTLKKPLRDHYRRKREYYTIHWPASYERNLYRVFSSEARHRSDPSAAQFLRHIRRDICEIVARGTGIHLYTINHIVKHMIVRSRSLNLRLTIPQEEARQLTIVALTMQVMQVLRTGYHRIPL